MYQFSNKNVEIEIKEELEVFDDYDESRSSSSSDVTIKAEAEDQDEWWNTEIAHSEFYPDRFQLNNFNGFYGSTLLQQNAPWRVEKGSSFLF